ncbi:MAG: hypothetical protein N3A68_07165 [Bacteroidia bacterium]|jgi:uncharacterized protein (UPF0332 family)|nr:hypothetical protein [Bacteroidia bacterium]GIV22383.1 MAG: hypothetical protein KatS3mg025_0042 [Bacteroidia bacterium]
MGFRWSEFEEVAKKLENIAEGDIEWKEGALRSAIGRLYYAAFNQVREWAIRRGFRDPRSGAVHGNLRDFVAKEGYRDIAKLLKVLHDSRKNVDYSMVLDKDSDLMLKEAKRNYELIVKWLGSLSENMLESEEGLDSFVAAGDIPA